MPRYIGRTTDRNKHLQHHNSIHWFYLLELHENDCMEKGLTNTVVLQENEGRDLKVDIALCRELIGKLLLCDPKNRLTAEAAFNMPIFEDMVEPADGTPVRQPF